MRRTIQLIVSGVCLTTIFASAKYAVGRERLRQTNLHDFYQQVNRESFQGNLPDVSIAWSDLPDEYGVTNFYSDGTATIGIDRASVTTEQQLRKTMRHEMCHVAVAADVERLLEDNHGPAFQNCLLKSKW